jgi:ATP-dependent HslUV protease subunit HslV
MDNFTERRFLPYGTTEKWFIKHHARKVRRIYNNQILVGFAGATADALNLSERLETKLERYNGNLIRSAVELAKDWRTDKFLRRLEALMLAADRERLFLISGNGDVIEPDEGVIAIGSGGIGAQAAATALMRHTQMEALQVAQAAMQIASSLCVFTNHQLTIEELNTDAAS